MSDVTWKDMLAAGAPDARIQTYRELLEKALEEHENRAHMEDLMNRALWANLEALGPGAIQVALANLGAEVERGLEDPETFEPIPAYFTSFPIYLEFPEEGEEEV